MFRKQCKISNAVLPDGEINHTGVPQGTRFVPFLFVVLVNYLYKNLPLQFNLKYLKYLDDFSLL